MNVIGGGITLQVTSTLLLPLRLPPVLTADCSPSGLRGWGGAGVYPAVSG